MVSMPIGVRGSRRIAAVACALSSLGSLALTSPARATPALTPAGPAHAVSPPGHFVSEFDAAADPNDSTRLVVAAIDADKAGTDAGCMVYLSTDAGSTWRASDPFGAIPGSDLGASSDPRIVIDRQGRLHVVCLFGIQFLGYVRSDDFGRTWTPVSLIPPINPENFARDKPALYVAPTGRIVVCALQDEDDPDPVNAHSTIGISVSDDLGATWRTFDSPVFKGYAPTCLNLSPDANDNLTMGFESLAATKAELLSVGSFRSTDGGATWSGPAIMGVSRRPGGTPPLTIVDAVFDPNSGMIVTATPDVEVDRSTGAIFGAFGEASSDGKRWQLALFRSIDGGGSYQPIVSPAPPSPACAAQMHSPVLHATPTGTLFLEFLCNSNLNQRDAGTREVWLTASLDQGSTWLDPALLVREDVKPCTIPWVTAGVNSLDICSRFYNGLDYWFTSDGSGGYHAYWVDHSAAASLRGASTIRTQVWNVG